MGRTTAPCSPRSTGRTGCSTTSSTVFDAVRVFHGSFDLEAVSAVCEPIATAAAFDPAIVLGTLVDKSMVVATGTALRPVARHLA
ncbi:MAG: hypothetical protein R2713_23690 [Ilumatobacteraceae bacterium]